MSFGNQCYRMTFLIYLSMKLLFILIICLNSIQLISQYNQWQWVYKLYGSADRIIRDIDLDKAGNIYLLIDYRDHEIQSCNLEITSFSQKGSANCIIKLNPAGECIWLLNLTNEFGEAGFNQLSIDYNGNIFLAGGIAGQLKIGSQTIGFDNWEISKVLIKLSNDGELVWWKYYRIKDYSVAFDHFSLDHTGDIYATLFVNGSLLESLPIDSSIIQLKKNGLYARLIIIKWDKNGKLIWVNTMWDEGGYVRGFGTSTDNYGNLIITGVYDSDSLNVNGKKVYNNRYTSGLPKIRGQYDMFVAKFDRTTGVAGWLNSFGGEKVDYFWDLKVDRTGNIFISGAFSSSSFLFGNIDIKFINGVSTYNQFLVSIDSLGSPKWGHSYSPLSGWAIYGSQISLDSADNIWFGVSIGSKINIDGKELTPRGILDLSYLKFSNIGTIIDVVQFGEIGVICYPSPFILDHSGALLISGSFVGDSLAVGPYKVINDSWDSRKEKKARDFFLTKLIPKLISNENDLTGLIYFKISIHPNPARDLIQIDFDDDLSADGRVEILTTTGTLMKSINIGKGSTSATICVHDWPAGVYLCRYIGYGGFRDFVKFMVE